MQSDVKQRLMQFLIHLGIGQRAFAERAGLSAGFVNAIRVSIQPKSLGKISAAFPELSISWLLTGEGEMLRKEKDVAQYAPAVQHPVRYFPNVSGSMGGVEFLDNPDETSLDIVIPGFADCQFAINAYGDSMYPLIHSGQIIVLVEWTERFIDWGNIYFVVTRGGFRTVKRLFPASNTNKIICRSENEAAHPPFEVDREDVVKLYLVKGWISRECI